MFSLSNCFLIAIENSENLPRTLISEYGVGQNILITGDAGVGKTNLIYRCLK